MGSLRNVDHCPVCGGVDHALCDRDKQKYIGILLARVAELEEENSSMADDICSLTTAHERAEQAEAALAERNQRLAAIGAWYATKDPDEWERCMTTYREARQASLHARAEEGSGA